MPLCPTPTLPRVTRQKSILLSPHLPPGSESEGEGVGVERGCERGKGKAYC